MKENDLELATRTLDPSDRGLLGLPRRCYFVVYEGGSSTLFHLPQDGQLVIGRSTQADICLPHESVSRRQVLVRIIAGIVSVEDLGSHNGTRVNGIRIEGPRRLANDDVLGVGAIELTFKGQPASDSPHPVLDAAAFHQRMLEETERAARYTRPLTLVLVRAPAAVQPKLRAILGHELRLMDVVGNGQSEDELQLLLPETDPAAPGSPVAKLTATAIAAAPEACCGVASFPDDGIDAEALQTAARSAANAARPGSTMAAAEIPTRLQIGARTIVVAEPAMMRAFSLLKRLASADLPVLVLGETGAGKEIAASAIHQWSRRHASPLVAINCAAIQETLVESELFGHERGAFSGAVTSKPGMFETAHGGTIFLDEVGELSPVIQAKLLCVLETKQLTRVGATRGIDIDIRIVAATNVRLVEEVEAGRFRRDLYFRLSAATITLPPLRERRRELPLLARAFLSEAAQRSGDARELGLAPETMKLLLDYGWPGNVRELRNTMDYAASVVTGNTVLPEHLPSTITEAARDSNRRVASSRASSLADEIKELERKRILDALAAAGGNQTHAAEAIGMPLRTFVSKLKLYGAPTSRPGRPPRR